MIEQIEIYQTDDGALSLTVALMQDTVWLSQTRLVQLFGRDKSVISRHINNIFNDIELEREAVVADFAITATNCVIKYSQKLIITLIVQWNI